MKRSAQPNSINPPSWHAVLSPSKYKIAHHRPATSIVSRGPLSALSLVLVDGEGDHRLHGPFEVGVAVDGPKCIGPNGLMRGINHRVCGARERSQGCHRQSSVRWSGVTLAAQSPRENGQITYNHGTMTVLDGQALERAACECHGVIQREFARLVH
jgi:hypothetical protein